MSTIERLATFVANTPAEAIPEGVLSRARLQAVSAFAAALGSPREPGVRKVLGHLRQRPGSARLLATGDPVSLHAAVVGNATSTCAFDWDEILLLGHPSHSAVSVAWALGETLDATLGEVLAAQVVADELIGRLGLACFFGPQNGQHQPYLHHLGGAAAAARLLGADGAAAADALAIALAQPQAALWPAFLGDIESKALTAAHPAEQGLAAAEHAAAGVRGPRGILDHPRGFFHRFTFLPAPHALTGLGDTWLLHTLQVKEHAACWYYQAPLDAMGRLRDQAQGDLTPESIRRVRCGATLLATAVHGLAAAGEPAHALRPNTVNFRLDYSLGLMLLHGRVTPTELSGASLARDADALRRLSAVTEITHHVDLSRATVAAVHDALDLPGLLDAGPLAVIQALGRARREFTGMGGVGGSDLVAMGGELMGALRRLWEDRHRGRARHHPYDLGDPDIADAVSHLTLPCGAALTLELTDGRVLSTRVDVPGGAVGDAQGGRAVVRRKLRAGLEAAHRSPDEAEEPLGALLDAPLHTPIRRILDTWVGGGGRGLEQPPPWGAST